MKELNVKTRREELQRFEETTKKIKQIAIFAHFYSMLKNKNTPFLNNL
jgi:hypothetical protein